MAMQQNELRGVISLDLTKAPALPKEHATIEAIGMTGHEAAKLMRETTVILEAIGDRNIEDALEFRDSRFSVLLQKLTRAWHRQTHGLCNTPEYRTWSMMIQRCTNPNRNGWKDYGGRGITVCERWRNSFKAFLEDMGPRPDGKTLDRWPDKNGNYEKSNCRWATKIEQGNNLRKNRIVIFKGQKMTLTECSRLCGVGPMTLRYRLDQGMTVEEALHNIKTRGIKSYA